MNKLLWDEQEITRVLREYVILHFPQNSEDVFDTVEDLVDAANADPREVKSEIGTQNKIISCCSTSNQKSAALLYLTWKLDDGDLVGFLLGKGANPNATDPDGRSCLHLSCCAGHYNNVEALLKKRNSAMELGHTPNDIRYINLFLKYCWKL